jgi:hypothetical protein
VFHCFSLAFLNSEIDTGPSRLQDSGLLDNGDGKGVRCMFV